MEKQPIDDLFARNLRDTEITPGADVFGRLQSRMNAAPLPQSEPKRRIVGWWYGVAAAGVLVAAGWLGWHLNKSPMEPANTGLVKVDRAPATGRTIETNASQSGRLATKRPIVADRFDDPLLTVRPAEKESQANDRRFTQTAEGNLCRVETKTPVTPHTNPIDVPISLPAREPIVAKTEEIKVVEPSLTGRTVIMTIVEPELALASTQPVRPSQEVNSPNLSHLFERVKQLKSGDVFARATPVPQPTEAKSGLKRLVNGVRESLRNENTL